MSHYYRTSPENSTRIGSWSGESAIGSWGGESAIGAVSDEEKALLAVGAMGLAMTVVKWSIIGFVGYKVIKAVAE